MQPETPAPVVESVDPEVKGPETTENPETDVILEQHNGLSNFSEQTTATPATSTPCQPRTTDGNEHIGKLSLSGGRELVNSWILKSGITFDEGEWYRSNYRRDQTVTFP